MPRGDRTGPNGMGSQTGRAAGYCSGNNVHGYTTDGFGGGMRRGGGVFGRGAGRGFNRGAHRGFGVNFPQARFFGQGAQTFTYSQKDEKVFLENEINILKNQLDQHQSRVSELNDKEE